MFTPPVWSGRPYPYPRLAGSRMLGDAVVASLWLSLGGAGGCCQEARLGRLARRLVITPCPVRCQMQAHPRGG